QVTGVPTPFKNLYSGVEGGLAPTNNFPDGTRALQLPDSRVASSFLDSFGRPERTQTCSCERQQDSSVSQALHLNNGQTLNDKLRSKNSRVEQWMNEKVSDEEAVRRLFFLGLCLQPTGHELNKFKTLEQGGENGSVVLAGKPDESRIVLQVEGKAKPKMPPAKAKQPQPDELKVLRSWIATGAKDDSASVKIALPSIKPRIPSAAPV